MQEKMFGIYLGKILKHLPHGRCKIYIPSAYPEKYANKPDLLPSAQQAAPLFAGSNAGNGVFSYPNIGATVYCLFINGDINFPIYFAAALGSENAFGQYSIVKKDLKEENGEQLNSTEAVSNKHLVTSGKTHIKWFENGKISAIVEDPIRTICSVDYDSWELANDNISADDKYKSKLSNDNVWKIRDNKLSNIDCQLVLDNNGGTFGQLSTSTHRFNIIDDKDDKKQQTSKGTLSIDNWNIMSNDGKIKHGTLSTIQEKVDSPNLKVQQNNKVKNLYELMVPGIMNSSVKQTTDRQIQDLSAGINEDSKLTGYSNFYFDYNNNYQLTGYHKILQNKTTDILTTNITSNIENVFSFEDNGSFRLSSINKQNTLCIGQIATNDNVDSDIDDWQEPTYINVNVIKKSILSSMLSTNDGDSAFQTISSATIINGSDSIDSNISNQLIMSKNGCIKHNSHSIIINNGQSNSSTIDSKVKSTQQGATGWFNSVAAWKMVNSDGIDIKNSHNIDVFTEQDASVEEQLKSKKMSNGSSTVDYIFNKGINAQKSIFNIFINDKISKNQFTNSVNTLAGIVEVIILNNQTSNKCVITFDSQGRMIITTTDKLEINTANSVTITTPQTTINGATTINGTTTINGETSINNTLHVTSQTTIDADANIGGKSFLGHTHVGNAGAPTSPPI